MKKGFSLVILIAGALVFVFSGCMEEQQDMKGWPKPRPETLEHKQEHKQEYYTVQKDDTISTIAEQYGVSPQLLAASNGLELKGSGSIIYPGQKLVIPVK